MVVHPRWIMIHTDGYLAQCIELIYQSHETMNLPYPNYGLSIFDVMHYYNLQNYAPRYH